jgi:glc operon protein GlcG
MRTTRSWAIAIPAGAMFLGTVHAGTPERHQPLAMPSKVVLTLEAAGIAIDAGLAEAASLNAGGAIAVTDDGGHLVSLVRIDGTFPAAAEVATAKARTAALFKRQTKDFEDAVRSGRNTLLAVNAMTPLEGGVPITVGGQVIGAVGVSGAHSSTEDVRIATVAAETIAARLNTQSSGENR